MALTRAEMAALGTAGLWAAALPALLLASAPEKRAPAAPPPLLQAAAPPPRVSGDRTLFAGGTSPAAENELPGDAPELIGIAGRIGRDAVAMVRENGRSRTLGLGDSAGGWRLESLAIDAAYFTRGAERLRVPVDTGQ